MSLPRETPSLFRFCAFCADAVFAPAVAFRGGALCMTQSESSSELISTTFIVTLNIFMVKEVECWMNIFTREIDMQAL